MEIAALAVSILVLAAVLVFLFLLRRDVGREVAAVREQGRESARTLGDELRASREELGRIALGLREEIDRKLGETVTKNVESFSAVTEKLGKLHEATGQIVELSKGVRDLNALLQTPRGRGAFGEMTLEQMLGDLFGEHTGLFETQYPVEEGERVDAAIFVKPDRSQFLCVDAKFPLANATPLIEGKDAPEIERAFRRDVRERAGEIRSKYIRPPNTLDFAFMFVPSEAVYYLLLRDTKLHEDLLRMRVVPTSPNSFYAYLHALSAAFRGMKIEERTREIQKAILQIGKEFDRFAERFQTLDGHLRRARSTYDESYQRLEKFRSRIDSLKQGEVPDKPELVGGNE